MKGFLTERERIETAKRIFDDLGDWLASLAARYEDEKGYEPIGEYAKAIQAELDKCKENHGAMVEAMFEIPFGFVYRLGDVRYMMKVGRNCESVSYCRVEDRQTFISRKGGALATHG